METLWAPPSWWAGGALGAAAVWLVLAAATPSTVALAGALTTALLIAGGLIAAGRVRVGVQGGEIVAGAAHLPLHWVGAVTPLDADEARRVRGPGADANAFLLLRPWVATAIRVDVVDPADPTPYWLVSTRRPERFAAAVSTARGDAARWPGGTTDEEAADREL
ncbi:MAG TPA: DUF3093 domain-containing protein [Nocardioidaceae bacterium]|nr:DUF3093 domain-containing protein [Nocardioidaceae bacterium]